MATHPMARAGRSLRGLLVLLLVLPAALSHSAPAACAQGSETRRNKFIPPASRLALDLMALEMRRMILARDGRGNAPAWGRIDNALHALLGLVPYPTEHAEVELLEMTLECLLEKAPDVGAALQARWRKHQLLLRSGSL